MKIKLSNEKFPRGRNVDGEYIKAITVDNDFVGSIVFIEKNNDFKSLLKITINKEYRNKGIGSFVVDKLLETYNEFEILDIKPSAIKFWKKWNVKIKRDFDYCFYSKISRL
tara:strand:- start:356 stop:688 length:333 start_codon:yes stop_codon:yes gene_type:complete